jgi:3D (Asp-Asp-Asp) domain-containing protein
MLVTFYDDYGYMADGTYTYSGAAACGYDLPFGVRVYVPGVGLLTCHDRIGVDPWAHIDVWMPSYAAGVAAGLGLDYRTVTVYR